MSLLGDIIRSYFRLPVWVQVWIGVVLVPVNLATILVLDAPFGLWIAGLSYVALAVNVPIVLKERGMGKLLSLSHLVFWAPQVLLIVWVLGSHGADVVGTAAWMLPLVVVVNAISLIFDVYDFRAWMRGQRGAM